SQTPPPATFHLSDARKVAGGGVCDEKGVAGFASGDPGCKQCRFPDRAKGFRERRGLEMTGEENLPALTPGTLYLVATPIGNLEDITLRALRTLRECDLVAAEDTRHTGQLLKHFQISTPLLSCFPLNEAKRSEEILARLQRRYKDSRLT